MLKITNNSHCLEAAEFMLDQSSLRRRAGDRFLVAFTDGTTKKKEIIFKIIRERDEEYDIDLDEQSTDDESSKCDSVSQSSQDTSSTCSSESTDNIKRKVSADPHKYKKIYRMCQKRVNKVDLHNQLKSNLVLAKLLHR